MSKRNIIPSALSPYLNLHLTPSRTRDKDSLVVLTSVLGTSTNWLILRFLYSQLSSTVTSTTSSRATGSIDTTTVPRTIEKKSGGKSTAQKSTSRDDEVIHERRDDRKQEDDDKDGKDGNDGKDDDDDDQMNVVLVSFLRDWEFWRREAGRLVRSISHLSFLWLSLSLYISFFFFTSSFITCISQRTNTLCVTTFIDYLFFFRFVQLFPQDQSCGHLMIEIKVFFYLGNRSPSFITDRPISIR